jgi:hypothetical protein
METETGRLKESTFSRLKGIRREVPEERISEGSPCPSLPNTRAKGAFNFTFLMSITP